MTTTATAINTRNCYLVGRVVSAFERASGYRFTAGCLGNLSEYPSRAPLVLRHVWTRMQTTPACAEILTQIAWDQFLVGYPARSSFWLGYNQTESD